MKKSIRTKIAFLVIAFAMFVVAIVLHKMIYGAVADDRIVLESLTLILFDVRVLLALAAILAVGALLIWK